MSDYFHLYEMEWNEDIIEIFVNGTKMVSLPMNDLFGLANADFTNREFDAIPEEESAWKDGGPNAPFDTEFYLVLNNAVGTTNGYFPDTPFTSNCDKPYINDKIPG